MDRLNCGFEVKFAADADEGVISGYGAVFGNTDSYGDVIAKGAFRDTLRESKKTGNWPALLSQHGGWGMSADDLMPIGIWTSMEEDDKGLYVEGKLALNTQRGKDAFELLKMQPRPALNGLSIGFFAKEFALGTKPGEPRRTLKKIDLVEVSLVTSPANPKARVSNVKTLASRLTSEDFRDYEATLRMKGLSRTDAVKAVSGLKEWLQRDAGAPDTGLRDEAAAAKHLTELLAGIKGVRAGL